MQAKKPVEALRGTEACTTRDESDSGKVIARLPQPKGLRVIDPAPDTTQTTC
jgi:hypothetical protein